MRLVLSILLIVVTASNTAKAKQLFRKTDKGPYGTYVLYDQLPSLIPHAPITVNYQSPGSKFQFGYNHGAAFVAVASYLHYDEQDIKGLKNFLTQGNVVVLSTYFLSDAMEKWLNVKLDVRMGAGNDSIKIFDLDSGYSHRYPSGRFFRSYISKFDSAASELQMFGTYDNGDVNFICFKKENGYVVLQTQPYMFSNYHLMRKKTEAYSEVFFSSLPGPIDMVIWDESAKAGSNEEFSALSFIMKHAALRNAFWLAFLALVLLVLFSFKRRQRVIPVIQPLSNTSLDLVRTASDMYYYSRRNEVMAKKKISHWLEFLRVKYNVFSSLTPDAFWQTVRSRSDINDERMHRLRLLVEKYRDGDERISDSELLELNDLIDSFYTT